MKFAEKFLSGIRPTPQDWEEYLIEAHRDEPAMTSQHYKNGRTSEGLTSYETLAQALKFLSKDPSHLKVVDLACGEGYLLNALTNVKSVVGVDMSEDGLALARKNAGGRAGADYICARAQDLPFGTASIDAVLCHMAFMLMTPVEPVVREISRVLKPGGIFSFVVNTHEDMKTLRRLTKKCVRSFGDIWQKPFPILSKTLLWEIAVFSAAKSSQAFFSRVISRVKLM
jgi:SAM-dependent methyltransferase